MVQRSLGSNYYNSTETHLGVEVSFIVDTIWTVDLDSQTAAVGSIGIYHAYSLHYH